MSIERFDKIINEQLNRSTEVMLNKAREYATECCDIYVQMWKEPADSCRNTLRPNTMHHKF
ncbi:MAG: hypothetical protein RR475_02370 [Clostridia bacterium]